MIQEKRQYTNVVTVEGVNYIQPAIADAAVQNVGRHGNKNERGRMNKDRWTLDDYAEYMSRTHPELLRPGSQAAFIQSGDSQRAGSVLTRSGDPNYRLIVVPGVPISKPRQTRSDKWNLRECVKKYRAWADSARKHAGKLPQNPQRMDVVAYFPLTKKAKAGLPHMVRPDSDNILKAVADSLFPDNDSMIHEMRVKKRYDDGGGPRVEITLY